MAQNNKCIGNSQLNEGPLLDQRFVQHIKSTFPRKRQEAVKWYGWGYNDSQFYIKDDVVHFKGEKYPLHNCALPSFSGWAEEVTGVHLRPKPFPEMPKTFPQAIINGKFLSGIKLTGIAHSQEGMDRLIRCHGQTIHEIYTLWRNEFQRIPDFVVWPHCHNDCERIVALAHEHNVVLIPFGGGTSVSGSITCPQDEKRMICVLDTSEMNKMLWFNAENLTACFETGIVGQDLERQLNALGMTVGHEPDSYEFSTLGGWVATRASGMKKNVYGNIEDIVLRIRLVTPKGVLERDCAAPRFSCGPDFNQIILGSEGTLGVVTEAVLKVRPLPPVRRYGSLVFPDFELGVQFMREVAKRRCQPASVRLMDNDQFYFGQCLKPAKGWLASSADHVKKFYLTTFKGIDLKKICAATLLFEGEAADVQRQETVIYEIAKKYKGIAAGEENGERGYIFTFVIAYIRDLALSQEIFAESMETAVPWDRCSKLCRNVKLRVDRECRQRNIKKFLVCCRVTQTYDAGACVYIYFGFCFTGMTDPTSVYDYIESCARDEILACGGSLSHHHGIGKLRSRWYRKAVSDTGCDLLLAAKRQLDPRNIFALSNLLPESDWQKLQQEVESKKETPNELGQQQSAIKSKL